ncbi:DUF551 domain-containing protein [Enterobacter hormaechei]|uniref:DUF551 domain-containing protein n=2 Tax=Enterobacter hormaechei TaxID=158836 RepID=UPI0034CD72AF
MSTLTKEWLLKTIAELEEERDAVPGIVNEDAAMALEAMKRALASLEAEPVAFRSKLKPPSAIGSESWGYTDHRQPDAFELESCVIERLYTAPPAPFVPDEINVLQAANLVLTLGVLDNGIPTVAMKVWNSCRAAMLQSFGNSEQLNSQVIPDGLRLALSNAGIAAPESDEMLAATCEKCIQELVTWVKERKPFRSAVIPDGWVACSERMPADAEQVYLFTDGAVFKDAIYSADEQLFFWSYSADTCEASDASHWMPMIMPAAPQQEVKP